MAGLWSLMFLVRSSGYTAWLASIRQAAVSMRMRTPVRPMPALKLVVNDTIRDLVRVDGEVPVWGQLMAGGCAGAAQVCVTNPLEIIKIRLQIIHFTKV